jgi:hypothetical protein
MNELIARLSGQFLTGDYSRMSSKLFGAVGAVDDLRLGILTVSDA